MHEHELDLMPVPDIREVPDKRYPQNALCHFAKASCHVYFLTVALLRFLQRSTDPAGAHCSMSSSSRGLPSGSGASSNAGMSISSAASSWPVLPGCRGVCSYAALPADIAFVRARLARSGVSSSFVPAQAMN